MVEGQLASDGSRYFWERNWTAVRIHKLIRKLTEPDPTERIKGALVRYRVKPSVHDVDVFEAGMGWLQLVRYSLLFEHVWGGTLVQQRSRRRPLVNLKSTTARLYCRSLEVDQPPDNCHKHNLHFFLSPILSSSLHISSILVGQQSSYHNIISSRIGGLNRTH